MADENIERYGIYAAYSFDAQQSTFAQMDRVVQGLRAIEQAVDQTSAAIKRSGLAQNLKQLATQAGNAVNNATTQMNQMGKTAKATVNPLQQISEQFRVLRAESRTIDLSHAVDPKQFQRAESELKHYIGHLEALKRQIDTTTPKGRTLAAQIVQEQQRATKQLTTLQDTAQSSARSAAKQLQTLGKEFRALRAEAHNIDFGDLDDPDQFKQATQQIHAYIAELKKLETQIDRTTPEGRTLAAQVQRQQTIADNRVQTAQAERAAARAQQRQGSAAALAATGTAVMLPIVGIGTKAIDTVKEFNDQMMQIKAVIDPLQATAANMDRIRQKAKDLGATTSFSASDAASGFVLLAQAGYDVNQQVTAIDGTLNLAAAGQLGLARATEITVSTLGQFQLNANKATHAANVLAQAAAMGQLDVNDMGESLKYTGGAAKRANLSLEQTSAMLALLSEGGLKGEMAGTNLASMITSLTAPNTLQAKALKELGVQTTDARGRLLPFEKVLGQVVRQMNKLPSGKQSDLVTRIFGTTGSRAFSIIQPRFAKISETTQKIIDQSDAGIGAAKKQANIMESDIGGAFRGFQSAVEGVFIEIGELLVPAVKAATQFLTALLSGFIALPKPIKTAIVVVGVMAAGLASLAIVVGTVSFAFFGLQSAMAQAGLAMTAMSAKGIPLTGFFSTAMQAFSGGGIVSGFTALGTGIQGAAAALGAFITGPVGLTIAAGAAIVALLEVLTPGFNVLGTVIGVALSPVAFLFGTLKGALQGLSIAFKPILAEFSGMGVTGGYLADVFSTVSKIFTRVAGSGEAVGKTLGLIVGVGIATPLRFLIKSFKGLVEILRGLGNVAGTIASPMIWAVNQITKAWRGFVDWFQTMPLVKFALDIAQKLINALNHNPTERIPEAWWGAVQQIQEHFGWLGRAAEAVAGVLQYVLDPSRIFKAVLSGLIGLLEKAVNTIQDSGLGKVLDRIGMDAPLNGLEAGLQRLKALTQEQPVTIAVTPTISDPDLSPVQSINPVPLVITPVVQSPDLSTIQSPTPVPIAVTPVVEQPKIDLPAALQVPVQFQATGLATLPIPDLQAIQPLLKQMQDALRYSAAIAQASFTQIQQSWRDNWQYLQASGTTDLSQLFAPGLSTLQGQFTDLRQDLLTFAQEATIAIQQMDWDSAKTSAQNFGISLVGAAKEAGKAIGGLTLSTIALGVFSLTSLSPIVLVLGGIGLAALALATDFLGIRTALLGIIKIVGGMINVVRGAIEVITALLKTIGSVARGTAQIISGILPALRGDFSQIQAGWHTITNGFQTGALEIQQAFSRMGRGIVQIFQGAFQVVRGLVEGLVRAIVGLGKTIQMVFRGIGLAIQGTGQAIRLLHQGFTALPGIVSSAGAKIQAGWRQFSTVVHNLPFVPNLNDITGLPSRVGTILERTTTTVSGAVTRIRQAWERLHLHFPDLNLSSFSQIPSRVATIGQSIGNAIQQSLIQIRQTWDTLRLQFPHPDLTALMGLGDRIKGMVQSIQATFEAGVNQIRTLWNGLNQLSHLPALQDVMGLVQRLPAVFSEAIGQIKALWGGLGDKISGVLSFVRGRTRQTGDDMVGDLAEHSPGPTYQIRLKWAMTTESIQGKLIGLAQQANVSGQKLAANVTDSFSQIEAGAKAKLTGVKTQIGKALSGKGVSAVGRSMSAVGMSLSNVSPQLAAPLFIFSDLIDTSQSLSQSLPEAQKFFTGLMPKVKGLGGTVTGLVPKLGSLLTGLVPILTSLGTTALTTIGTLMAPLLPIIGVIAAIGTAVFLLHRAWQKNFLGIRDLVQGTGKTIQGFFGGILLFADRFLNPLRLIRTLFGLLRQGLTGLAKLFTPLFGITSSLQSGWQGFQDWFGSLLKGLPTQAIESGKKLRDSLYTPAQQVPPPWQQAVQQVRDEINTLPEVGKQIGAKLQPDLNPVALPTITAPEPPPITIPVTTSSITPVESTAPTIQAPLADPAPILTKQDVLLNVQIKGQQAIPVLQSQIQNFAATAQSQLDRLSLSRLTQTGQSQLARLQQQVTVAFTDLLHPIQSQGRQIFEGLSSTLTTFADRAQTLLNSLMLTNLNETAQTLGDRLKGALQNASGQFGIATLSAIAFGASALLSLSPIVLVLGGIGLAVLALATNFLGVRTAVLGVIKIMGGLINIVRGAIGLLEGLVNTTLGAMRGIGQILGGILPALRGDFTQIQAGWQTVVAAFQQGGIQIHQALERIGQGISQVFQGAFQVVRGLIDGIIRAFADAGRLIQLSIRGIGSTIDGIGIVARGIGQGIEALPGIFQSIGQRIQSGWQTLGETMQRIRMVAPDLGGLSTLGERLTSILSAAGQQVHQWVDRIHQAWNRLSLPIPTIDGTPLANITERFHFFTQQLQQLWHGTAQAIDNTPILREFIEFVQTLPQVFSGAIERIQALWGGLTNSVGGFLNRLTGKARQTGQQMVSDLAENSPGPTFQIRLKWQLTTEQIQERLSQVAQQAQISGQQMAERITGSFDQVAAGAKGKLAVVSRQMQGALNGKGVSAVGRSFSSVGMVLSNVAPQFAAPLFMFNDLIDASQSLSQSLPEAQKFFSGLTPRIATMGTTLTGLLPKLTGFIGGLLPLLTSLGSAGIGAIGAFLTPLLPLIGILASITIGVILLRKAFQKNFLGIRTLMEGVTAGLTHIVQGVSRFAAQFLNPLRLIQRLFNTIQSGIQKLVNLFHPLTIITTTVQTGWQGFRNWFGELLDGLPTQAINAGQKMKTALHEPAKQIPPPWHKAVQQAQDELNTLPTLSQQVSVQLTPDIQSAPLAQSPIVAPPSQNQDVLLNVQVEGQQSVTNLQSQIEQLRQHVAQTFTNLLAPIQTQGKQLLGQLTNTFGQFANQAQSILNSITLENLNETAQMLGKRLKDALQQASSQFGFATLSAVAFGVSALLSLSPIVLVLGGIGLAVLAITTNFLGVRTAIQGIIKMIGGLFNVVRGLTELVGALLNTVMGAARGAGQALRGIPAALRGDFSEIQAGFNTIVQAFQVGGSQIHQAFSRVGHGITQIFQGAFQAIKGIVDGFIQTIQTGANLGKLAFRSIQESIDGIVPAIQAVSRTFQALPDHLLGTLTAIQERFTGFVNRIQSIWNSLSIRFPTIDRSSFALPPEPIQTLFNDIRARIEAGIQQIRATWDTLRLRFPSVDLSQIMELGDRVQSALSSIKTAFGTVVAQIEATWNGLAQGLQLPRLEAVITAVRNLPNIFSEAIAQIKQLWGGLGDKIGGVLNLVRGKSRQTGQELIGNLAEASPGPTFHIRRRWIALSEVLQGKFETIAAQAKGTGQQISASLGNAKIGKGITAGVGKVGNVFSSLGVAVSNFSPQLAGPLFLVGDMTDAFTSLADTMPDATKLFGKLMPQLSRISTTAQSGLTQGFAKFSGIIGTLPTLLTPVITTLMGVASAAMTALSSILVPALPVLAILGAIVGAVLLVRLAFRRNFLGIRSLVEAVGNTITGIFRTIGAIATAIGFALINPFRAAANQIRSAWEGFRVWFTSLPLVDWAAKTGQGLIDRLNHSPTIQIPIAWEGAVGRIQALLFGLPDTADSISRDMVQATQPDLIPDRLSASVTGFGAIFMGISQQVTAGFNGMTRASLWFGATSLTALAPIGLILGGIALAALAISVNFLGIRTILAGLIRIIQGVVDIAVTGFKAVIRVLGGILTILRGIPAALRGDFSQILAGWNQVVAGIRQSAQGLMRGLGTIFGGGVQVIQGIWEGLGQALRFDVFGQLLGTAREFIEQVTAWFTNLSQTITNTLAKPIQAVQGLMRRKPRESLVDPAVPAATQPIAQPGSIIPRTTATVTPTHPQPHIVPTIEGAARSITTQTLDVSPNAAWNNLANEMDTVDAQMTSVQSRTQTALNATTTGISSLGVALSNFAPQVAAPLFIVTDLIDGFLGITQAIPIVKAAIMGNAAATTVANAEMATSNLVLAGSNETVAATSLKSRLSMMLTTVQQKAVAAWNWVVAASNAILSGSFWATASAAVAAWSSILAPILPIVVAIGVVVAAVVLLYRAFRNNFGGIRDIVSGVVHAIQSIVGTIWNSIKVVGAIGLRIAQVALSISPVVIAFKLLWGIVQGVLQGIGEAWRSTWNILVENFTATWSLIQQTIGSAIQPFVDLFQTLRHSMGQTQAEAGGLGTAIQAIVSILLIPIKLVAAVLGVVLRVVGLIAQTLVVVGGFILKALLVPFRIVAGVIAGIVGSFQQVGSAATGIFQSVQNALTSIAQAFQPMIDAIVSVGVTLRDALSPLLGQAAGQDTFGSGITTVVNALLIPVRLIATIISTVFKLVSGIIRLVTTILTPVIRVLAIPIQIVATLLNVITTTISTIFTVIGSIVSFVGSAIQAVYNLIPAPIRSFIEAIGQGIGSIFSFIIGGGATPKPEPAPEPQRFARGGIVQGPGTSVGDRIPSLLSAGEFVVNAAATQTFLPFLNGINEGQNPIRSIVQGAFSQLAQRSGSFMDAISAGMPVEAALQLLPVTPPPITMPPPATAPAQSGQGINVTVNLTIQNITVVSDGEPNDAAAQIANEIRPEFERMVRDALRDLTERMR